MRSHNFNTSDQSITDKFRTQASRKRLIANKLQMVFQLFVNSLHTANTNTSTLHKIWAEIELMKILSSFAEAIRKIYKRTKSKGK